MIRRVVDATPLNTVANDPAVRPWLSSLEVGGAGAAIDLSPLVLDLANFALVTDGGGFFLHCLEPGQYEVHSMFLPSARRGTIRAMREGFEYMFTRTPCERIVTKVPDDNLAALGLSRAGGFRPMFRREACWNGRGVAYMGVSIEDWAQGNRALEGDGEWFHQQLEAAKRAAGSEMPTHAHDPAHERAVGAAVRMIRAGNAGKGVAFYNRWARLAGYVPIGIVQNIPLVLDVVDAVIELRGDDMEVLLCR